MTTKSSIESTGVITRMDLSRKHAGTRSAAECVCPLKWRGHGEAEPDDKRVDPDCPVHGTAKEAAGDWKDDAFFAPEEPYDRGEAQSAAPVNEGSRPGKFEAEPGYVERLWEIVLDGAADDEFYDGETPIALFYVDQDLRELLSREGFATNLDVEDGQVIAVWESDQGFVNSRVMSPQEAAAWEAEADADVEDEDEDFV